MASEISLPPEIIMHIISFIPRKLTGQITLWACSLVSYAWYSASNRYLYESPILIGANFDQFVRTICPSKNVHIRASPLAALVRRLDMGDLVHDASRSLTARLLGRLKCSLEVFVAPQVSFAVNSLAALSKCTKLRYLDLSLISSSISHKALFQAIRSLTQLETILLPRSSINNQHVISEPYNWPSCLNTLHVSGGVDDQFFIFQLTNAPKTLSNLGIQHCPQVHASAIIHSLCGLGSNIAYLSIIHPMPRLYLGELDGILRLCPALLSLRISVDFISENFFKMIPVNHALQALELECSHSAETDITPNTIFDAIDRSLFPDLRRLKISPRLAWDSTSQMRSDIQDLSDILEAMEIEKPLHIPCGVWITDLASVNF